MLYDLGFRSALLWLADQLYQEHGFQVEVKGEEDEPPLEDEIAAILFRSVRELLMNAIKYSGVDSATVVLQTTPDRLWVEVCDDGVGFDPQAQTERASDQTRFGLLSICEQIDRLGGEVQINAAPGQGCRVQLATPLTPTQAHTSERAADDPTRAAGR